MEPCDKVRQGSHTKSFMKMFDRSVCPEDLLLLAKADRMGDREQARLAIDHGHMNFAQAAEVAAKAGAKQLWLAHYSQMIEDPKTYLPNAASIFAGTVCGEDGMRTTLQFEK